MYMYCRVYVCMYVCMYVCRVYVCIVSVFIRCIHYIFICLHAASGILVQ
jgi:hypothetical protein